jgi:hypothetical protein
VRRAFAACLLLALGAGCPADLTEPTEVIEPRLMGARVEVEADPTRTRPALGERFSLRQYLALPPGAPATPLATRYAMNVALCLGVKTATGTLACVGEQKLTPTLTPVSDLELVLSGFALDLSALNLPPDLLGAAVAAGVEASDFEFDRVALFGVLCVDGKAESVPGKSVTVDPPSTLFRCVDNQGAKFPAANAFTLSVLVNRGRLGDDNHNPLFACDPAAPQSPCAVGILRDNEPLVPGALVLARPKKKGMPREVVAWPPLENNLTLPWDNCAANPNLLQVRVDSGEHTIRARFDPSDRERYLEELKINGVDSQRESRESLLLTQAATANGGELGRFDSLLSDDELDGEAEVSVSYTPPETNGKGDHFVPENGRLVRFYFTVRDQRGGVDYTVRELCLVPRANPE